MEKRVSIRDIAEMHLSQQLERKKALLLNLELDACARQGIPWTPTQGILSLEDRRRYEMNQSIILPNGTFTKQFSLPNYFRGENAYAPTGKNLQKYDVADKYIPGIRKECAGGPGNGWNSPAILIWHCFMPVVSGMKNSWNGFP